MIGKTLGHSHITLEYNPNRRISRMRKLLMSRCYLIALAMLAALSCQHTQQPTNLGQSKNTASAETAKRVTSSEVTFAPLVKGMVMPDVECSEFHSRFTGHDYHVYVSLPASYGKADQRYPVLYVLDHQDYFLSLKIANDFMSYGNMLEDYILVGVPLKSEGLDDWARKRAFDLTPTEVEAENKSMSKQYGGDVHTGGASMFLRALREELIPFIESKYRVTSDRGLAGYSFGGLFAAYAWLSDGNTFSRYLIGSPSLWWDNGMMLKVEAAVAKSGKTLHGRVFLSVGADEDIPGDDPMVGPLKNLTTVLTSHAYPNLRLESHIFEGEVHLSGSLGAFSRGLRFLYGRPQPK